MNKVYICITENNKVISFSNPRNFLPNVKTINNIISHLKKIKFYGQGFIDKWNKEREQNLEKEINEFRTNTDKGKYKPRGYVYIFKCNDIYKIGITCNVNQRLKIIQAANFGKIEKIYNIHINRNYNLEKKLHNKFQEKRVKGEWFELDNDDLIKIKRICKDWKYKYK